MKFGMKNLLVAVLALFVGQVAVAQTEAAAPAKDYDGTAEVSSMITNGNTKNQTTGLAFDLNYKPDPWLVNLKSKYLTTVSQEVQTQEMFEARVVVDERCRRSSRFSQITPT
ncbi:MAG: hypothetical protein IPJ84_15695 [Bdellovibrionales bacterium]|nr:hypothetical protein [Bdellovibrionales bacterium]